MINTKEIEKLAALSRIKMTDEEKKNFQKEIESILTYIDQIKKATVSSESAPEVGIVHNIFREDENPRESGTFTEKILKNVPKKQGNYFKVKKIL